MDKQSFLKRSREGARSYHHEKMTRIKFALFLGMLLISACTAPLPQDQVYAQPVSHGQAAAATVEVDCISIAEQNLKDSNFRPNKLVGVTGIDYAGIYFLGSIGDVSQYTGANFFVCDVSGADPNDPQAQAAARGLASLDIQQDMVIINGGD